MSKRKTKEQFIEEAVRVHDTKYDYKNIIYVNTHTKIKITCPEHGIFEQRPNRHLLGDGCPRCASKTSSLSKTKTIEHFIKKAKSVHGETYNYSNSVYTGMTNKITITCPQHGDFSQRATDHIYSKAGCPTCGNVGKSVNKLKSTEQFIETAISIHKNRYDYSATIYNGVGHDVVVICNKHGSFRVTPSNHITNKSGCPKCYSSKGEIDVRFILNEHNIKFIEQKTFDGCISPLTGYKLRYDFFIPSQNILIEYDGIQHFKPTPIMGITQVEKNFKKIQIHDKTKDEFASKSNIHLIRVPYYVDNIQTFLEDNGVLLSNSKINNKQPV